MATDFLRPDADTSDGNWTNESGNNTNLFDSINETSASDSDYIRSGPNPINDICKIQLSNPPGSTPQQPMEVLYRYKKTGTGFISLRVRLLQGTTEIASVNHSDVGSSYVDGTLTLTSPQFAAITDFNDLFLEFRADASPPLLLDALTVTALGAWSFRKLRAAYAGSAIRMRNTTTDVETDIGFDASGNLDTTAAASAGTVIAKIYDQSGNGNDLVQSTEAAMPTYSASGIGSKPTASFDGLNDYIENTSLALGSQPKLFTAMVVTPLTGMTDNTRLLTCSSCVLMAIDTDVPEIYTYSGIVLGQRSISLDTAVCLMNDFNGTNHTLYLNNSGATPVAWSTNFGVTETLAVAADPPGSSPGKINMSELIVIVNQTVGSTDRNTIDSDHSTYWGV